MAETLGLVSSVGQIVDLFVKVGVMCSIYCMDVKNAPSDARRILKEADKFTSTLKNLESMLAGQSSRRLESSASLCQTIEECRLLLLGLVAKLDLGARHKRAVWPFKKRDVQDIVVTLERHKTAILMDLNVEQTATLLSIHQETVLSKLRIAEAATYDSILGGDESLCLSGTRVDIIRQIEDWSNDPSSESIFWLNGMAGTGKSTISRTIAHSFEEKKMLGASFFLKRGGGDRGRISFVFPTIAAQLVRKLPSLAPFVREAIDDNPAFHEKAISEQFESLILGPLKKASIKWQAPSMVVVIDALDESDREASMRTMLRVLSQARGVNTPRLKFFLTSRPELPIRLGFAEISGKYEGLLLAQIPKPVIQHDIDAYMRHQLDAIRDEYNMSVVSTRRLSADWPGKGNLDKLVTMAIPLFIVAATICRLLRDRRLGGPQNQLSGILAYQTTRLSGLDATYLPVLDRLLVGLSQADRRDVISRFRRYVGSIVVLASPLSITALARLHQVPTDVIEDQLDLLHSVLSVPSDSSTPVRLLHLSFRDFLLDSEKRGAPDQYPFWVDEQEIHYLLFSQCLKLLSSGENLKKDICSLRLPGTRRIDISQAIIDTCLPPESQYACLYWVHHLKLSCHTIQDDDIIHQFLNSHLLHWLEALSLMGRVSESYTMIGTLGNLLSDQKSDAVSNLVADMRRFVLSNIQMLDVMPLQLYCSAIVFSPQSSIVRGLFQQSFPSWITKLPCVAPDWDPCLLTLAEDLGHTPELRISRNGEYIVFISLSSQASAEPTYTLKVWDVETVTYIFTYSTADEMTLSHDGSAYLVRYQDRDAAVFNAVTGEYICSLHGCTYDMYPSVFSLDSHWIVLSSSDTIGIWDTITGNLIASHKTTYKYPAQLKFSFDGTMLLWVCTTYPPSTPLGLDNIYLWRIGISDPVIIYEAPSKRLYVHFSPDQKSVMVHHVDAIKMIDLLSFASADVSIPSTDIFHFLHNNLLVTSARHALQIWDITRPECLSTLTGHRESVTVVKESPDGSKLASGSRDKTIKIWDLETSSCICTLHGHQLPISVIAFSPGNEILVSGSKDGFVKIWDTNATNPEPNHQKHDDLITSVVFSPNGSTVASASNDATLKVWDLDTNNRILIVDGHWNMRSLPQISQFLGNKPSHSWVLSDKSLRNWPQSAIFLQHGSRIVSSHFSCIKVWDLITGECIEFYKSEPYESVCMVLSPDGVYLAVDTHDHDIEIWNMATSSLFATCKGHTHRLLKVQFSLDGAKLASHSRDNIVRLWNSQTGETLAMLDFQLELIDDISLFPDGSKIGISGESSIYIWDAPANTTCKLTIPSSKASKSRLSISLDGSTLAQFHSLQFNSVMEIFRAEDGELLAELDGICPLLNLNSIKFDSSKPLFPTNIGTIILPENVPEQSSTQVVIVPNEPLISAPDGRLTGRIEKRGIGLSADGERITWGSETLIWLPPTYRPSACDIFANSVAIGTWTGVLFWIELEPSNLPN